MASVSTKCQNSDLEIRTALFGPESNSDLKISVLIPVYNRPTLLMRALGSVCTQTYQPHEVIVVDDGSDDDLIPMLDKQYPRVKLIKQSQAGVSSARNLGVKHASGDWVAFLDSDDEWLPQKLEQQVAAIKDSKLLLCHTDEIWIRNGVRVNSHNKHKKFGGDVFEKCLARCLISPSSVVINKNLFNQIGGFDEKLVACEDYDLWLRITSKHQVKFIEQPLIIKYGGHNDQLSRKYWGMDRFRIYSMEKLLTQTNLAKEQKKLLLKELVNKCTVFSKGALKNNNQSAYRQFSEKLVSHQNQLNAMS